MKRSFLISILSFAVGFGASALIAHQLRGRHIESAGERSAPAADSRGQVAEAIAISEVTLERHPCNLDACPAYSLTLRRDGTATYIGERSVPRIGRHRSAAQDYRLEADFARLAQLITAHNYLAMSDIYNPGQIVDGGTVSTSVVHNGRRKTVRNYANQGPVELYGIEMAIDGVAANIQWEEDK